MARLDKERELKLLPIRETAAIKQIKALGHTIISNSTTDIKFLFKGNVITYFYYSGWASGKGIKDGRGLQQLLIQIK